METHMTGFGQQLQGQDCSLTAFSIVLGKPVEELIKLLGHNGRDIVHLHLPAPLCCRGFNVQEWIDCCLQLGKALILIERKPLSTPNKVDFHNPPFDAKARFNKHLHDSTGVLFGKLKHNGHGHALAWKSPGVMAATGSTTPLSLWPLDVTFFAKIVDTQGKLC